MEVASATRCISENLLFYFIKTCCKKQTIINPYLGSLSLWCLLGVCVSLSLYVFQISKVYSRTGQAWMTFIKVVLQETRYFLLLPLPPEPLSFGLSLLPQASLSPLKHCDYLWLIKEVLLVFHKMDAPHTEWPWGKQNSISTLQAATSCEHLRGKKLLSWVSFTNQGSCGQGAGISNIMGKPVEPWFLFAKYPVQQESGNAQPPPVENNISKKR